VSLNSIKDAISYVLLRSGYIGKTIYYQYIKAFKSVKLLVVYIETTNYCNRSCVYCPNSVSRKPKHRMETELIYKIVDELAEANFAGAISPLGFGEPLLDERIFDVVRYMRLKLPTNKIYITTNGDFLTKEMYYRLLSCGVDHVIVSMHDYIDESNRIQSNNIEYSNYSDSSIRLNNRAGAVSLVKEIRLEKIYSCWSIQSLTVDSYGDVKICCNDYHSVVKYGNVAEKSIIDVWNGEQYKRDRDRVAAGFFDYDICKKCTSGE